MKKILLTLILAVVSSNTMAAEWDFALKSADGASSY